MIAQKKIRVLIVDDEMLARERIAQLLQKEIDIEIIGECRSGLEAVNFLRHSKVDVVFLDIQMPELNGFEVLQHLPPKKIPFIVFVTAYDTFAIQAFDIHALDYLLKPFDRERFQDALKQIRDRTKKEQIFLKKVSSLVMHVSSNSPYLTKLSIKSHGKILLLPTSDIFWIEAKGNYLQIQTNQQMLIYRGTIKYLESKLDPSSFIRVHRSSIINVSVIKELQLVSHHRYTLLLRSGVAFDVGKTFRSRVSNLLRNYR